MENQDSAGVGAIGRGSGPLQPTNRPHGQRIIRTVPKQEVVPWVFPLTATGQPQSFAKGSEVQIRLRSNQYYRGIIHMDPILTPDATFRLVNARSVDVEGKDLLAQRTGITSFPQKHVVQVYVYKMGKKPETPLIGFVMKTFVIRKKEQLESVLHVIKTSGVKEIGVKLFFQDVPNAGELLWIVLCTHETMISLDISEFLDDQDVWNMLKHQIFENKDIVKMFYDSITDISFLFHTKGISIKNHFDTKTGVFFMDNRLRTLNNEKRDTYTDEGLTLVDCLQRFLSKIVPEPELDLLEKMKNYRLLPTDRSNPPPHVTKYMTLTVKYLGNLKDVIEKKILQTLHFAMKRQVAATLSSVRSESNCLTKLPSDHWHVVKVLSDPYSVVVDNTR